MAERRPGTTLAEIEEAGHDLHLDQPGRWREALYDLPRNPRAQATNRARSETLDTRPDGV